MADHAQTIVNTIGLVAGKPAQFWGPTMTWGTSTWGNTADFLEIIVEKVLTNSLTLADPSLAFSVAKELFESLSLSDAVQKEVLRIIAESLSLTGDSSSQTLQDANNYFYVFRKPTTNNETTVNTSYSSQSASSISFTSQTNTSTVWS